MDSHIEPEIILYDLACTKDVCFSPVVWRIRLMLNYKRISYQTIFLEFQDIEPTLKELGIGSNEATPDKTIKYTVPVICHVPTKTYIMDSTSIAQFIESTYSDPPLPLTSELGSDIEAKSRSVISHAFKISIMPREIRILSPGAQHYFRQTRESLLGHQLEDLLDRNNEEKAWNEISEDLHTVSELIRTHETAGPFILGALPSYTDFFIAGCLQNAKVVDESVFIRIVKYSGFKQVYDACQPYMTKSN